MLIALGLAPLWNELQLVYYEAAIRQIDPLHPDVPHIVRRINELQRRA